MSQAKRKTACKCGNLVFGRDCEFRIVILHIDKKEGPFKGPKVEVVKMVGKTADGKEVAIKAFGEQIALLEHVNQGSTAIFTTLKVAKVYHNPKWDKSDHVGPFNFELFLKTKSKVKVI